MEAGKMQQHEQKYAAQLQHEQKFTQLLSPLRLKIPTNDFASSLTERSPLTPAFAVTQRSPSAGVQEFWSLYLSGTDSLILDLPLDHTRPSSRTGERATVDLKLADEILGGIGNFEQQCESDRDAVLLAFAAVLFHKVSASQMTDICIGGLASNRNLVCFRVAVDPAASFRKLISQVNEMKARVDRNASMSFESIASKVCKTTISGVAPIFQVTLGNGSSPSTSAELDLHLLVTQSALQFVYATDVFERRTVETMAARCGKLLTQLFVNSAAEKPIHELDVLLQSDGLVLAQLNETAFDFGQPRCAHEVIFERAKSHPQNIAVVLDDKQLTYRQLMGALVLFVVLTRCAARASVLGEALQSMKVGPNVVVAQCVERSLEMIIGMVAILMSGGAYFPLHPDNPQGRLLSMLDKSKAQVLLTTSALSNKFESCGTPIVLLETATRASHLMSVAAASMLASQSVTPGDLAYVLSTSGSTGEPKLAAIAHHSLFNFSHAVNRSNLILSSDHVLQTSACSFDVHILEVFSTLMLGGTIVMLQPNGHLDMEYLSNTIHQHGVTVVPIVPSLMLPLIDYAQSTSSWARLSQVRVWRFAGEPLPPKTVAKLQANLPKCAVVNCYGPAECTVDCTIHWCVKEDATALSVPIGKVFSNCQCFVLDTFGHQVPVGSIGQLFVGGSGVMKCYLHNEQLTQQAITFHPTFGRLYRTGDLVRVREDGCILFLGRSDFQVKIRGQRMELGEIEATILKHESVSAVVVSKYTDAACEAQLSAHVSWKGGEKATERRSSLVALCRQRLPAFMVPRAFVIMSSFPMNSNGKVDRKKLPAPTIADIGELSPAEIVEPKTSTESKLAAIWSDILCRPVTSISTNASFFELGSSSLQATYMLSRLRADLQADITMQTLFEKPTIVQLAELIAEPSQPLVQPWQAVELSEARASLGQTRILTDAIMRFDRTSARVYNDVYAFTVNGTLDLTRFEAAVAGVMQRHSALRTALILDEKTGVVTQRILPSVPSNVRQFIIADGHLHAAIREKTATALDIEKGQGISFFLFREPFDDQITTLVVCAHHALFDGWSLRVLLQDVSSFYSGQQLSPLPLHYINYSVHEEELLTSSSMAESLSYWSTKLKAAESLVCIDLFGLSDCACFFQTLDLPLDRPRPALRSAASGIVTLALTEEVHEGLGSWQHQTGATRFTTLMATVHLLLHKISVTRATDICVGSLVANRYRTELEPLVGMFANTVVHRTEVDPAHTFTQLHAAIQSQMLECLAHQWLPIDLLVRQIKEKRPGVSPFFQVTFREESDLTNAHRWLQLTGCTSQRIPDNDRPAYFDLDIIFDGCDLHIAYAVDVFNRRTVEAVAARWEKLLQQLFVQRKTDVRMHELYVLLPDDQVLLTKLHDTAFSFGTPQCVHDVIMDQWRCQPNKTAVVLDDKSLSYSELIGTRACLAVVTCLCAERASRVAFVLRELDVEPNVLVAQRVERSLEMIIGMLGILMAGGVYFPIHPELPADRMRTMISKSHAKVLLTTAPLAPKFAGYGVSVVLFEPILSDDADEEVNYMHGPNSYRKVARERKHAMPNLTLLRTTPQDLCYVLSTSGSTGEPKLAAIAHYSLFNFSHAVNRANLVLSSDRVLQTSACSFDVHILEVYSTLMLGGTVVMLKPQGNLDLDYVTMVLDEQNVTVVPIVPSLALPLLEHTATTKAWPRLSKVRVWRFAGEPLPPKTVAILQANLPKCAVVNCYGPAECTVDCTIHWCVKEDATALSVSIGKVFSNCQCFVLDNFGHQVPVGSIGQLFVGGSGVMKCYLHNEQLTQQAITFHPTFGRLYRTGDLVRVREDGCILFLGRSDFQVKIRGQRLELGEIETTILKHPNVSAVVATKVQEPSGDASLSVYVAARPSKSEADDDGFVRRIRREVTELCRNSLPAFMVPSAVMVVANLPLNSNGKVDRKQLRPVSMSAMQFGAETQMVAPQTKTESVVTEVLASILQVPAKQLSVVTNFASLGCSSLTLVQLLARLRASVSPAISMHTVLGNQTIQALAKEIDKSMPASKDSATSSASTDSLHFEPSSRVWTAALASFHLLGVAFILSNLSLALWIGNLAIDVIPNFPLKSNTWLETSIRIPIAAAIALTVFMLLFVVAKWMLVGRWRECVQHQGTWLNYRRWLLRSWWSAISLFLPVITGTPFFNMYLRMLGMSIGANVYIYTVNIDAFDLISIGHDTFIGRDAVLKCGCVRNGLSLHRITIGNHVVVGEYCVIGGKAILESGSTVQPFSFVANHVPAGAIFEGTQVVSRPEGADLLPLRNFEPHSFAKTLYQLFSLLVVVYIAVQPMAMTAYIWQLELNNMSWLYSVLIPLWTLPWDIFTYLIAALPIRLVSLGAKPGRYPVGGWRFLLSYHTTEMISRAFVDSFDFTQSTCLRALLLKMMGASVGKNVAVVGFGQSFVSPPSMLEIGDDVFLPSELRVGTCVIENGEWVLGYVSLERGSFMGNRSGIASGGRLPSRSLQGSLTHIRGGRFEPDSVILGVPAQTAPFRHQVTSAHGTDETVGNWSGLIMAISAIMYRALISLCLAAAVFAIRPALSSDFGLANLWVFLWLPIATLVFMTYLSITVIAVKWLLIGRFTKSTHVYQSMWYWRRNLFAMLTSEWMRLVGPFVRSTEYAVWISRALGATIGHNVILDLPMLQEHDLFSIGDRTVIEEGVSVQPHTFEFRMMQVAPVHIGSGCYIGAYSMLFPDSSLASNVVLDPLTLVLRGDNLGAFSHWRGNPVQFKCKIVPQPNQKPRRDNTLRIIITEATQTGTPRPSAGRAISIASPTESPATNTRSISAADSTPSLPNSLTPSEPDSGKLSIGSGTSSGSFTGSLGSSPPVPPLSLPLGSLASASSTAIRITIDR